MDAKRWIWIKWKLPWSYPEDIERFREMIAWEIVVMWKWTYDSLKKYYPNSNWHPKASNNIVLSKTLDISWVEIYRDPQDIIENYKESLLMIIWWWETYEAFLPYADELYLTQINEAFICDVFFPEYERLFKKVEEESWIDPNLRFERWVRKDSKVVSG